ncbi:uncharacterized protein LOC131438818 [Malaya genurostris]|uniref:uncharacterized protein LOC131438818 n=1 Tax=Malaya genurostris TaxID=325434 RepID=UPI0026F3865F|nr:uncharacterized protein LOC131438818 [Malaya genurostris]
MNPNYVRKCEEYLQNIPSQKVPGPVATGRRPLTATGPSSRKLTQSVSIEQKKQSINNNPGGVVGPTSSVAGSRGKQNRSNVPTNPGLARRSTAAAAAVTGGLTEKQPGSKFIRSCCHQPRPSGTVSVGATSSWRTPRDIHGKKKIGDNVNQIESIKPAESDPDYGMSSVGTEIEQQHQQQQHRSAERPNRATETWDGLLAVAKKGSTTNTLSPPISMPPAPPDPTPLPSGSTSVSSSSRPTSSIATVPPQPRPSVVTVMASPSTQRQYRAEPPSPSDLEGINLFRFDPLRTLQFLSLELKSKLKELCPEQKKLYKISKELLYAVKILTEDFRDGSKMKMKCGNGGKSKSTPGCDGAKQAPTEQSKEALTDQQQQRKQRDLEEEIKRLQAVINDKQSQEGGLIADLNRKLHESTSRCRRLEHARNEAEKRLLHATLENDRLNFLLSTQISTMTNLRSDFSAIQSLAHKQIEQLNRTHSPPNGIRTGRSATWAKKANATTSTNNHHRNYRHPSGGSPRHQLSCSSTTTSQEKLPSEPANARKLRHHYSFKNIAEKESDDGNDANDSKQPHSPSSAEDQLPYGGKPKPNDYRSHRGDHRESGSGDNADAFHRHWKMLPHQRQNGGFRPISTNDDGSAAIETNSKLTSSSTSLSTVSSGSLSSVKRVLPSDTDMGALPPAEIIIIPGDPKSSQVPASPVQRSRPANATAADGNNSDSCDTSIKTNDCVRLGRESDLHHQNHRRRNIGRPTGNMVSSSNGGDTGGTERNAPSDGSNGRGKYPRDYGDKFELRESYSPAEEKKLCQNRPIIGQIRDGDQKRCRSMSRSGRSGTQPEEVKEPEIERTTGSAANEPAPARKEEFSIDFDDITLPSSPSPFTGGRLSSIGCGLNLDGE